MREIDGHYGYAPGTFLSPGLPERQQHQCKDAPPSCNRNSDDIMTIESQGEHLLYMYHIYKTCRPRC